MTFIVMPATCPKCESDDVNLENAEYFWCGDCGHEWGSDELEFDDPDFHDHYEDGTPVVEPFEQKVLKGKSSEPPKPSL